MNVFQACIHRPGRALFLSGLALVCTLAAGLSGASAAEVRGEVVAAQPARRQLIVRLNGPDSEAPFEVDLADAEIWQAGALIRANRIEAPGLARLESIWPDDPLTRSLLATGAARLRADTMNRGRQAFRGVGERCPDFILLDQRGKTWESSRLRGQLAVFNFIFTRCTQPAMCPASTAKMKTLQKLVTEAGWSDVQLVTITLDPVFDTPGVLRRYAEERGVGSSNHVFLTGPEEAVEDLQKQLGILAEEDERLIVKHTLMTTLADRRGKIVYQVPGSGWSAEDFYDRLKELAGGGAP